MKKFNSFLLILTFIVSACTSTPQVTITPEPTATLPPPTETPIPTPTLHPKFAELQEQIAASGGRFTLNPDGTIFDGAEPLPGVTIALDGTMTLTVDGETVTLDPTKAVFDDENGFSYPDYEQDANGNWVVAENPAEKQLKQDLNHLVETISTLAVGKLDLESGSVTLINKENGEVKYEFMAEEDGGGNMTLTDPVTGEVVYKGGKWDLSYARVMIGESGSCKVTKWKGVKVGPGNPTNDKGGPTGFLNSYVGPLYDYYMALVKLRKLPKYGGVFMRNEYLGNFCWGVMPFMKEEQTESVLLFKDTDGRPMYVPVFMSSADE